MPEPTQPEAARLTTVVLNERECNALINALHDKASETRHYLLSYSDVVGEPKETDTCCQAHRERYEDRKNQYAAFVGQQQLTRSLIDLIEGASFVPTQVHSVNPEHVALIYRAEDDTLWDQPLTELSEQGGLIDPEDGSDMPIVSAQITLPATTAIASE